MAKKYSRSAQPSNPVQIGLATVILLILVGIVGFMIYLGSYNTNNIELVSHAAGFPGGRRMDYVPDPVRPPIELESPRPESDVCPPPPCPSGADVSCVQGYDPSWCLQTPRPSASPRPSGSPVPLPASPRPSGDMPRPSGIPQPYPVDRPVQANLTITDETTETYCGTITVQNISDRNITSWYVNMQMNQGQLTSSEGATFTKIFNRYFITPDQINRAIPAQSENANIHFCADKTGVNWQPSNLRVNYRFAR